MSKIVHEKPHPFQDFWKHAFAIHGSITPHVLPNVLAVGVFSTLILYAASFAEQQWKWHLRLEVAPYELVGAALAVLLVLRTNAGYDRWWEGRKIWGGIVNQCRNLAIDALAYGPKDPQWQREFIHWIAAFPHIARSSLRAEEPPEEVRRLLGEKAWQDLKEARHAPSAVAMKLAELLQEARKIHGMDDFGFLEADQQRALLIDYIGACERIAKTPLALAYCIKIRRFIAVFLLTIPLALMNTLGTEWHVPVLTMLVAYPLFSLDQLGIELQNPFIEANLSNLPLEDISSTIESNILALLESHGS